MGEKRNYGNGRQVGVVKDIKFFGFASQEESCDFTMEQVYSFFHP